MKSRNGASKVFKIMWISLLSYLETPGHISQKYLPIIDMKEGPQCLRASPCLSLRLLWEAVSKDPMHMNVEPILQNLNTTRSFFDAIRSVEQGVLLVGKSFNVVKNLGFVFSYQVVSVQ